MDAARATRTRRGLCAIAGLLCAFGVLCVTTVVPASASPHHHPHHAMTAAAVLADGHGTSVRTVDDVVTMRATAALAGSGSTVSTPAADRAGDLAAVQTVRTRGPPASA